MSRNRYVSDYRIVESIDGRGRIRSDYEYIGAPYVYAEDAGVVRRARNCVSACCLAGWVAWVAALVPLSAATRRLYTALPHVFAALPLALMTGLAVGLFREREPFEHRHADRLENRGPACSFFTALLGGAALAGEGISLLRGVALLPGDGLFAAGAAVVLACGLSCHGQWKRLRCRAKTQ